MSHIHLTTSAPAKRRVMAMGEEAWRVHQVGAPSLDHLVRREAMDDDAVGAALGVPLPDHFALVSFHPVTLTRQTEQEADALYEALGGIERPIVFCFPNSDAGSRRLIDRARAFCDAHRDAQLFVNLDHWLYWNVLRRAHVLIGNSSSGIMEAPAVGVPVIDVGERQRGRLKAANIVTAPARAAAITAALATIETPSFNSALQNLENPYGDGHASERIARVLSGAPDRATLLAKRALILSESETGPAFEQPMP
jgi:UDP-N-acetylglucosamine 2-epimerase (non-hydrolysing)/GDP/UDP-N,N'-diacetylbacillosamine 2-epimerase (hydrolysing)